MEIYMYGHVWLKCYFVKDIGGHRSGFLQVWALLTKKICYIHIYRLINWIRCNPYDCRQNEDKRRRQIAYWKSWKDIEKLSPIICANTQLIKTLVLWLICLLIGLRHGPDLQGGTATLSWYFCKFFYLPESEHDLVTIPNQLPWLTSNGIKHIVFIIWFTCVNAWLLILLNSF